MADSARRRGGPRSTAARALAQVLAGRSLSAVLPTALAPLAPEARPLLQELCYGTLRWLGRLDALLSRLMRRPLKDKDADIRALLLSGLYQLEYMEIKPHAAVSETVAATAELGKPWARGLVNGVLRTYQRDRARLLGEVDRDEATALAHPRWLVEALQAAWPDRWAEIAAANNARPPMTLRVNLRQGSREAYLETLAAEGLEAQPAPHTEAGITLARPVSVERLPGFDQGRVSVQDGAAQLAAQLLAPQPGERVLDACAAPGGKTGHLLERGAGVELVALDSDPERLRRVEENLRRLDLPAQLIAGDAGAPETWWDGRPFDRILLDAPCSGTGVIRRHPDIKHLRRGEDIAPLAEQQGRILRALWPLLKPGGMLVYATCSIIPEENDRQVARFLESCRDARELPIAAEWGHTATAGRQILPGEDGMDGFYYACLGTH